VSAHQRRRSASAGGGRHERAALRRPAHAAADQDTRRPRPDASPPPPRDLRRGYPDARLAPRDNSRLRVRTRVERFLSAASSPARRRAQCLTLIAEHGPRILASRATCGTARTVTGDEISLLGLASRVPRDVFTASAPPRIVTTYGAYRRQASRAGRSRHVYALRRSATVAFTGLPERVRPTGGRRVTGAGPSALREEHDASPDSWVFTRVDYGGRRSRLRGTRGDCRPRPSAPGLSRPRVVLVVGRAARTTLVVNPVRPAKPCAGSEDDAECLSSALPPSHPGPPYAYGLGAGLGHRPAGFVAEQRVERRITRTYSHRVVGRDRLGPLAARTIVANVVVSTRAVRGPSPVVTVAHGQLQRSVGVQAPA